MARKYTVTVPDELGEWLDDQPHLDPSGLFQKAIQDQCQKETSKRDHSKSGRAWIEDQEIDGGPDPNAENDEALEVAKAYPNDGGRGIIRLNPDALEQIDAQPGDMIELTGRATTAAKGWRGDRQDWNTKTARIDPYTRQNAEIDIGEHITIQKVEPAPADQVILTSPDDAAIQFNADAAGMIQRQLLKRPIVENDIVAVMSSLNHRFMRSLGQAIPLIAAKTVPDGVVVITEETTLELSAE